jgi:hypothetical protein
VCLAIDPQRQAVAWMRNLEKSRGLRELRFPSMDFALVLNECGAAGVPVLVAELSEDDVAFLVAELREMTLPTQTSKNEIFNNYVKSIIHLFT